jgi:three-Cys-motif partner protein
MAKKALRFAGAGRHISKATGQFVAGSPLNALQITPPFKELHLIDLDGARASELRKLTADDSRVAVHEGDCNAVLLHDVFPRCLYADYARALCLLDPYGLISARGEHTDGNQFSHRMDRSHLESLAY